MSALLFVITFKADDSSALKNKHTQIHTKVDLINTLKNQMADHNIDEIKVEVRVFGEEESLGKLEF